MNKISGATGGFYIDDCTGPSYNSTSPLLIIVATGSGISTGATGPGISSAVVICHFDSEDYRMCIYYNSGPDMYYISKEPNDPERPDIYYYYPTIPFDVIDNYCNMTQQHYIDTIGDNITLYKDAVKRFRKLEVLR
jgi:hypothetical protein